MAQPFAVDQSFPVHGEVGVPVSETIAFSFSREVSISTDWNTEFVHESSDPLRLNRVSLCLNFQGECGGGDDVPRHVRFGVRHAPDTDYTWMIYGVESAEGQSMAEPYVLRYTTASERGTGRVRGSVGDPAPASVVSSTAVRASLRALVDGLQRSERGRPVFDRDSEAKALRDVSPAAADRPSSVVKTIGRKTAPGPFTQVLLVEDFSIREDAWTIHAADALIGSSGTYDINFVRPGTYVPIAVRYTDGTNIEIDALGFHDPDGDGTPNSIDVDGTERSGIQLQLFPFPLSTARASANWSVAVDSAAQYADDQELRLVQGGNGMQPAGTAYEWTYRFVSPSKGLETRVTVNPIRVTVDTLVASNFFFEMGTIPDSFIDSDEALQIALNDGGQDFIRPFRPRNITTLLEGGNLFWTDAPKPEEEFWRVRIIAATSSQVQIFERYIDMETGEFLPVELTDFAAAVDGDAVSLRWRTASETGNAGFRVQHAPGATPSAPPSPSWTSLGFVEGAGTTNTPQTYRFRTDRLAPGPHGFRLEQIDEDGTSVLSEVVYATVQMEAPLQLTPPSPHPVRHATTLRFGLRTAEHATVALYDVLGRQVETLYEGPVPAHRMQEVFVSADRLPSGLYFVRLTAGEHVQTRRLVVVK